MGKPFHIDRESRPSETMAGRSARPDRHEKMVLARDHCIFFVLMPWKDASPPSTQRLVASGKPDILMRPGIGTADVAGLAASTEIAGAVGRTARTAIEDRVRSWTAHHGRSAEFPLNGLMRAPMLPARSTPAAAGPQMPPRPDGTRWTPPAATNPTRRRRKFPRSGP
jgi:hypothetical protein